MCSVGIQAMYQTNFTRRLLLSTLIASVVTLILGQRGDCVVSNAVRHIDDIHFMSIVQRVKSTLGIIVSYRNLCSVSHNSYTSTVTSYTNILTCTYTQFAIQYENLKYEKKM